MEDYLEYLTLQVSRPRNRGVEEVDGELQSASVTFAAIIHAVDQDYGL